MLEKSGGFTIEQLGGEFADEFADRIVHFGSCETLKLNISKIETFKKQTGARMVSGYTKSIDFIDSTLLDIAYFHRLQEYEKVGLIKKRMKTDFSQLHERLGFVAV